MRVQVKVVSTRFHLFGVPVLRLVVILLVLIAGTASIVLSWQYLQAEFALFLTIDLALVVILVILISHYMVKIRKERDRAIAAEHSKSLFFSTISHDIQTPLNAIIGYSELLKTDIKDKSEREGALEVIATSGHILLDLIKDVLDLTSSEERKTAFAPKLTDINQVASSVLHAFDVVVSNKNVTLEENFSAVPFLYVDIKRIRLILFNLIGNAFKFTEHGKIILSISFEKKTDDVGCLSISVSDTGCGMAPEDLENVLKSFDQTKETAIGTTGLGLSICNQLAKHMDGKLTIQSALKQGTTVAVVFQNVRFSTEKPPASK